MTRIGSLCSGYGGLELALSGTVAWHAETDPAATRVLAHHWPHTPNLGDIANIDWNAVEPVDWLTAGFPCQDVSLAGKRAGLRPGTRTGLWFEIERAIACLQPSNVLLENVPGLMSGDMVEQPNDRCVCGWAYRRRGLHLDHVRQRWSHVRGAAGCRDDHQGARPVGDAPTQVRWPHPIAQGSNIPVGSRRDLDPARTSGGAGAPGSTAVLTAQGRAGDDRAESPGDREWVGHDAYRPCALDPCGTTAVPSTEATDARAERQGAVDPATGRAVTDCQACGRHLGDRPVRSVFGSGLGTVLQSLAALGYDTRWGVVRASDAGAPHRRERVFVVASHADRVGVDRGRLHRPGQRRWPEPAHRGHPAADTARVGRGEGRPEPARRLGRPAPVLGGAPAADTGRAGLENRDLEHARPQRPSAQRSGAPAADTDGDGLQGLGRLEPGERHIDRRGGADIAWGPYEPAIRRWERVIGRHAPLPTERGPKTDRRLSAAFVEFLMGLPAGWVTAVPGLTRNDQLRCLGNGVVPAQAALALRLLHPEQAAA